MKLRGISRCLTIVRHATIRSLQVVVHCRYRLMRGEQGGRCAPRYPLQCRHEAKRQ